MEGDRPWPTPTEYVVVERRWTYAPPPWVMYEAVVDEMDRWLSPLLAGGEEPPKVAASRRPDAVLLTPWPEADVAAVELWISDDESSGSAMAVMAYGSIPALADDVRRHVRYRLGTIFGAALRDWVDVPHS